MPILKYAPDRGRRDHESRRLEALFKVGGDGDRDVVSQALFPDPTRVPGATRFLNLTLTMMSGVERQGPQANSSVAYEVVRHNTGHDRRSWMLRWLAEATAQRQLELLIDDN